MSTTITLTLPRPHKAQRQILRATRRFNVLACGRRFGKSLFGQLRLMEPMLAGRPVAWFAPNYKYLNEVWRDFVKLLRPVTRGKPNKTERRIELVTGGSIEFWTLDDPDAGRSRKYARVAIDEAAKCRNLEVGWHESILPTLTDLRGDADFYSTPKGRNFFWRLFARGQDPLQPEWMSWRFPTVANPYIDPAEVAAARSQIPERAFGQEYLAEFLEESAGVFRCVHAAIDKGRVAADPPNSKLFYSTGCDLARVEDFTVLSTLDPKGRQVHFDRFNQISWERQIEAICAVGLRYKGDVQLDATGVGDPILELLRKRHVRVAPFQFTNSSKQALIDHLALGLEQGKLRLMDLDAQTNELLAFEYTLTPSRKVIMSAPEGEHDDCVIGLALAYWGAANPQRMKFY